MAIIKVENVNLKFNDNFFFDTNVWLLLFGTISNYQKNDQKKYSKFFAEIISRENSIFINSMVISEFANVLLRIDFNQWKVNNKFYDKEFKKDYVGSEDYKSIVKSIKNLILQILSIPVVYRAPDDFNAVSMDNILNTFDLVDFNDSYISEISIRNGYKVVTNDADFKKLSNQLDVITSK